MGGEESGARIVYMKFIGKNSRAGRGKGMMEGGEGGRRGGRRMRRRGRGRGGRGKLGYFRS